MRSHYRRHAAISQSRAERDSLPFDGLVDYATAAGVMPGSGLTSYALVTKVSSTAASGSDSYLAMLSNPLGTGGAGQNITDVTRRRSVAGQQRYGIIGLTTAAANNYSRDSNADSVLAVNTGAVYAVARDLGANTARGRVVGSDEAIRWTFADIATAQDSAPQDLAIGAAVNHLLAPFAGTYFAFAWVATAVVAHIPTDVELQLYARTSDARRVWGDALLWYTTATQLRGLGSGPIPALVGTPPLTLSGPVEADLVPL